MPLEPSSSTIDGSDIFGEFGGSSVRIGKEPGRYGRCAVRSVLGVGLMPSELGLERMFT